MVTETGIFRIPPFFVCVTASKEEEGIMSEGGRGKQDRAGAGREIVWGIGDEQSAQSATQKTETVFAAVDWD